jgi:enoyl-CoA hydratase/carnithine racemase
MLDSERSFETLVVERPSEGVVRVRLDRPATLNSIVRPMLAELEYVYRHLGDDPGVRVIVLSGNGRAFCAGADLEHPPGLVEPGVPEAEALRVVREGQHAIDAIRAAGAVTIAAVHAHAIGGGALLAIANDIRLATSSTRFSVPEVSLGVPLVWGGSALLSEEVGVSLARELIMFGRILDGAEARARGVFHDVLPDEQALERAVQARTEQLLSTSPLALQTTKSQFHRLSSGGEREDQDGELARYLQCMRRNWPAGGRGA